MKFRLLSGRHVEAGVSYSAGDIVESKLNLAEVFVNKFEPVKSKAKSAPADERGKEVTKQFPVAVAIEIEVFKTTKGYNAYDNGELLNDSPIKKADMTAFLAEFESESEEE